MKTTTAICTMLFSLLLGAASARAAGPFSLSYGGRLANAADVAEKGPVDLEFGFYAGAKTTTPITLVLKAGVALDDGVFQVDLDLTETEKQQVFGDGSASAWVEIVDKTHKKTYPRQIMTAVPYAIAAESAKTVPVDGSTITFNGAGKLEVVPVAAQTPGGDVSGSVAAMKVEKLQNQPISTTAPSANQFLKFVSGAWTPVTFTPAGLTAADVEGVGAVMDSDFTSNGVLKRTGAGAYASGLIADADIGLAAIGDGKLATITTAGKVADSALSSNVSLLGSSVALSTSEVTGTLPIGNGGTGVTSAPANGALLIGNGTGYTQAQITGSGGITVTNGAGSINIAAGSDASKLSLSGGNMTGVLAISQSSTAVIPALALANDLNTGIFSDATDTISMSTSGTSRLKVDAVGNVGIGSTVAAGRLHVGAGGTGTNEEAIVLDSGSGSGGSGFIQFRRNGIEKAMIGVAGSPTAIVTGAAANNFAIRSSSGIMFSAAGQSATHMTIANSGNIGIGTTAPSAALSFGGTSSGRAVKIDRSATGAGGPLTISAGGAAFGELDVGGGDLILTSGVVTGYQTSNIQFMTYGGGTSGTLDAAPSPSMVILGAGNVGIGLTAPTAKLHVGGTAGDDGIKFPNGTIQNSAASSLPIRFTRAAVVAGITDTSKNSTCSGEFGTSYVAAHAVDVAIFAKPMAAGTFNVAGSTATVNVATSAIGSVSASSVPLACKHKSNPFWLSPTPLSAGSSDPDKDTNCTTSFGTNFRAATPLDLSSRAEGMSLSASFGYFTLAANTNDVTLTGSGSLSATVPSGVVPVLCVIVR